MRKRKNSFFTFCFSMIPGAGEMYMGFMKRGLSIMAVFFTVLFLAVFLDLPVILFAVPLIWFFGFFDTHNIRSMSEEDYANMKDSFTVFPDFTFRFHLLERKGNKLLAWVLIILGTTMVWNNLLEITSRLFGWEIYDILNDVPQYMIGIAILLVGIRLILGKKKEVNQMLEQEEGKNE